ncbi:MAG: hypothetical protein WCJ40_05385 [Planctomycetota bacterium]|nr:hypothetical protein [Planctomycetota bacterium]
MLRDLNKTILAITFALVAWCNGTNAQSITISIPATEENWVVGNNYSCTYTYTGVSLIEVKIINSDANNAYVYFRDVKTDNGSPATRAIVVNKIDTLDSNAIRYCKLKVIGYNAMMQEVASAIINVNLVNP